jgi:hypothetical protein
VGSKIGGESTSRFIHPQNAFTDKFEFSLCRAHRHKGRQFLLHRP